MCFLLFFIFFFFKQKTAYEMRISDWSSDVCSSDLLQLRRHYQRLALPQVQARGQRHYGRSGSINMSAPAFISKLETFAKIEAAHFLIGHERLWAARKKHLSIINDEGAINDKIGRESCRERACQSVYI